MSSNIKRKKRISKKTKSAWRKADVKDVEDYLEDQRQEERIGGLSFSEKKDDDLFMVDTTPSKLKSGLTEKQKRKINARKPMRSIEAMINTSKVQDPIVKRNHVKLLKNGRIIEDEVRNPTKPRHFQANKDRMRYYEKLDQKLTKPKTNLETMEDIWLDKDFRDKVPGLKDEKGWISKELSLHVMKNMGMPVVKVHSSIRHRTTKAKNFKSPHPGSSYNPSLVDHQALLNQVVEREEGIIKKEKHLKRVTTEMFSKVTPEERDERRLQEMSGGLDDDEKKEEMDEDKIATDNDEPYKAVNEPVQNKKRSKKARRKDLKQKELSKKQEAKKALKKQIADLNRIKSIRAEVLADEEDLNTKKKIRKEVALKKKFEPKRLGRLKYEEPDVDVNLPEDIAGNLRNLKTESSLLVDRFKNFQERNILAVSKASSTQKRKKVKRFARSSHKEPGVSYQMLREQRKTAKLSA